MPQTAIERSLAGSVAAHKSWSTTADRSARTAPANAALLARFERDVDPDGLLPPDERAVRVESARKAYFAGLALRSVASRRRAAEAREEAGRLDRVAAAADAGLAEYGPGDDQ